MRLTDIDELLKRCDVRETDEGVYIHSAPIVTPTFVNSLPTVDAEPVRHGKWIPKEYMSRTPFAKNYICSICGADPIGISNYCPNCGAKMDEEKDWND